MITNHPITDNGRQIVWPDAIRPEVERVVIYRPESEWLYSHHPHLTYFNGRYYAIWSNGRRHEDRPGQRVLLSTSADFRNWSEPQPLAVPGVGEDGQERVLTAAGFHQHAGTLVAYFADYGPQKETTRLCAVTTTDGEIWSPVLDMGIPVCPNHGPRATSSGRLIIAGNISFPYTDDLSGLSGWTMTGIYPTDMAGTSDDPAAFWPVAERMGWPTALCEGAFYQTGDGTLRMLLRATGRGKRGRLWLTESRDDGTSWSAPVETDFSDDDAKFHAGRLPDGRYYYVGNPIAGGGRCPLVLSLSEDGESFDRHYLLGETPYKLRRPEGGNVGEYGYPHTMLHDGLLHVIVSRQKEGVEVIRVVSVES